MNIGFYLRLVAVQLESIVGVNDEELGINLRCKGERGLPKEVRFLDFQCYILRN